MTSARIPSVKEKYRKTLIIIALLFLIMGIWSIFHSLSNNSITEEPPMREQAMHPVDLRYDGDLVSVKIPKLYNGKPAVGSAVLVDADSLKVLWSYGGDQIGEIASMTKMMLMLTTYLMADSGLITLDDTVYVTDEAPLMGGSQAYLDRGERYTLRSLMKAVSVASANDAAYLLASYIGNDSVYDAVKMMNTTAEKLNLKNTRFYNVHGLPPSTNAKEIGDGVGVVTYKKRKLVVAKEHNVSTPIEMAKLGISFCKFPELLEWTSIVSDSLWDIDRKRPCAYSLNNHFRLVRKEYVDGIKTGFTAKSGFCVTASAHKNGRRLIAVVFNAHDQNGRDRFVDHLFDVGYEYIAAIESPDSVVTTDVTYATIP